MQRDWQCRPHIGAQNTTPDLNPHRVHSVGVFYAHLELGSGSFFASFALGSNIFLHPLGIGSRHHARGPAIGHPGSIRDVWRQIVHGLDTGFQIIDGALELGRDLITGINNRLEVFDFLEGLGRFPADLLQLGVRIPEGFGSIGLSGHDFSELEVGEDEKDHRGNRQPD